MKKPLKKLKRKEFELLKSMGFLWEFYPDAPDAYEKIHCDNCRCDKCTKKKTTSKERVLKIYLKERKGLDRTIKDLEDSIKEEKDK